MVKQSEKITGFDFDLKLRFGNKNTNTLMSGGKKISYVLKQTCKLLRITFCYH